MRVKFKNTRSLEKHSQPGPVDFCLVLSWLELGVSFWFLGSSSLPESGMECVDQAQEGEPDFFRVAGSY